MALPTFDFGNLIRISLHGILYVVKSPIFYFSTLIVSMGVIFSMLYQHFIGISIPIIPATLAMPSGYGGVTSYFVYMLNVDVLVTILNAVFTILNLFIEFVPGMLLGLLVAMRIYSTQKHVYFTVKDLSRTS